MTSKDPEFAARESVEQVEEGNRLAPKFDADGLIPVVTTAAGSGAPAGWPFVHRSYCARRRIASDSKRSASGIAPRHSGQTCATAAPCRRMLATQPRQKRWPHGIVCGCCSASRQMAHSSSPPPLRTPPSLGGTTAATARGALGAARAPLAAARDCPCCGSCFTHLVLWPAFHAFLWQSWLQ